MENPDIDLKNDFRSPKIRPFVFYFEIKNLVSQSKAPLLKMPLSFFFTAFHHLFLFVFRQIAFGSWSGAMALKRILPENERRRPGTQATLTISLPRSKRTSSKLLNDKRIGEVETIGSITIFHLS